METRETERIGEQTSLLFLKSLKTGNSQDMRQKLEKCEREARAWNAKAEITGRGQKGGADSGGQWASLLKVQRNNYPQLL